MKKSVAQTLAEEIAKEEHVLRAYGFQRSVTIDYPRERGGRITLTLAQAKRHLDARKGNPR